MINVKIMLIRSTDVCQWGVCGNKTEGMPKEDSVRLYQGRHEKFWTVL